MGTLQYSHQQKSIMWTLEVREPFGADNSVEGWGEIWRD